MKVLMKFFGYLFAFLFLLIVFLPKENLYFFALEKLNNNKIQVSNSLHKDKLYGFEVTNATVFYDNIQMAQIKSTNINLFLFFNSLDIEQIKTNKALSNFMPKHIKKATATYSVFNPLKIELKMVFDDGEAIGFVDIVNKKIFLELTVSKSFKKDYRSLVKNLKYLQNKSSQKEDKYIYEYKL